MPTTLCPFCGARSHMTVRWVEQIRLDGDDGPTGAQAACTCDACKRLAVAVCDELPSALKTSRGVQSVEQRFARVGDDALAWFPIAGEDKGYPDVPPLIADAASEANRCRSVGAYRGAILLARAVVEASAKEKGITKGRLVEKIDEMHAKSLIREASKEAAHEIRHFGNDMAHGDLVGPPGPADADDVLSLMDELLHEVFQGPARVARLRAQRTTAKT